MSVGSLVNEYFAAVDSMKAGRVTSFFAQDASQRFGNAAPLVGLEAIKAANVEFFGSIKELHHEILAIATTKYYDNGERRSLIMVELSVTYIKLDGTKIVIPCASVIRMNRDKIQDFRILADMAPVFS